MSTRKLWWFYFAYGAGMYIFGFVLLARSGIYPAVSLATSLLDFAGLFGLFHYIKQKPFLNRLVWAAIALLFSARLSFVSVLLISNIIPWRGHSEQFVSLWGIAGGVAALPLLYALWSYAFFSKSIWARRAQPSVQADGPASGGSAA